VAFRARSGIAVTDRIAQARARLAEIAQAERDDPLVEPRYGTRSWVRDDVAPLVVLLLHGLTNGPPQYDVLGEQLAARGHAVIVPRLPYHSYRDRMTDALANLRASDLEMAALDALAIAALCGERVVVLGISIGATLAGWLAARTAVDTAIAVAPFCGVPELYGGLNDVLGAVLRTAPNRFGWWDPRVKQDQPPPHGYPRFATRALGASLQLSSDLCAPQSAMHGRRVVVLCNRDDPAVNNAFARRRFGRLAAQGIQVENVVLHGLPKIHDIIEPQGPLARPDLVYPPLIELIETP
jgi:pimeloyl-ACP methyl ester carboxylesterase